MDLGVPDYPGLAPFDLLLSLLPAAAGALVALAFVALTGMVTPGCRSKQVAAW